MTLVSLTPNQVTSEIERLKAEMATVKLRYDDLAQRFITLQRHLATYQLGGHVDGRSAWDVFHDSTLGLRENQIEDATNVLKLLRESLEDERARRDGVESSLRDQFLADDPHPTPASNEILRRNMMAALVAVENDSTSTSCQRQQPDLPSQFAATKFNESSSKPVNSLQNSEGQKKNKKIRTRPSIKTLRRVTSRQALATHMHGVIDFFKKDKKETNGNKAKDPASPVMIEEAEEVEHADHSVGNSRVFTTYDERGNVEAQHIGGDYPINPYPADEESPGQKRQPQMRSYLSHARYTVVHEINPQDWNFQKRQEESKRSPAKFANGESPQSAAPCPENCLSGRRHQGSLDFERDLIAGVEQEIRSGRRPPGLVYHIQPSEGSSARDGDVFSNPSLQVSETRTVRRTNSPPKPDFLALPRTDHTRLPNANKYPILHHAQLSSPSRALQRQSLPTTERLKAIKQLNRATSIYGPPTSPAPNHSLLANPSPSRSPSAPPTLYLHSQSRDDIFGPRPTTPTTGTVIPVRRLRHTRKKSEPSPTPRFISYRPYSPSPGGNEPLGQVGPFDWQQN